MQEGSNQLAAIAKRFSLDCSMTLALSHLHQFNSYAASHSDNDKACSRGSIAKAADILRQILQQQNPGYVPAWVARGEQRCFELLASELFVYLMMAESFIWTRTHLLCLPMIAQYVRQWSVIT